MQEVSEKKDLTLMAKEYGTDKYDHGYPKYYEKHLPQKVDQFLEIGVWQGASIRMFKDYYNGEGEFTAMDTFGNGVIQPVQLKEFGVESIVGSQSDEKVLESITKMFNVIVEDGSHHSDEQIITFKRMFLNNITPGGVYVCEDLCCCKEEYWWRGKVDGYDNTLVAVFKKFIDGGTLVSQYFTQEEHDQIAALIDEVFLYDDNILFVKKKDLVFDENSFDAISIMPETTKTSFNNNIKIGFMSPIECMVLSFTLKDQDFEKIKAKIIEIKDQYPNHFLIHGFLPRAEVIAKNIPTDVVDLLDYCFPVQFNMWNGYTLRDLMVNVAQRLDAKIFVIGEVKEGVAEEVELYKKKDLEITYIPLD